MPAGIGRSITALTVCPCLTITVWDALVILPSLSFTATSVYPVLTLLMVTLPPAFILLPVPCPSIIISPAISDSMVMLPPVTVGCDWVGAVVCDCVAAVGYAVCLLKKIKVAPS
ncbi:hypothetical protein [Treponema sp. R8-4-B8]